MSRSIIELPDLAGDYPLTREQIEAYRRDGHLLLRGVCTPDEVAAYRAVFADAVRRLNTEQRPLEERDTYGRAFLQTMNLWETDEASRRFVMARRFARIAGELMGVDGVRLYHDQALYKEAGGGHTPWHQDHFYWPLETDACVTMWMPLVDADERMGTMTFAGGSHRGGFLGHIGISDASEDTFREFVRERGFPLVSAGAMQAGDATFHSGWTLHAAPGNQTGTTREVMTVIYFADGSRVTAPDNANRQADLDRWLPGCEPGGPAASRLNPVLWRRDGEVLG